MNDNDEDYRPESGVKWLAGAFALVLIGCMIVLALIVTGWFR